MSSSSSSWARWRHVLRLAWGQRQAVFQPPACQDVPPTALYSLSRDTTVRGWVVQPGCEHAMVLFSGNSDHVADHQGWMRRAFPHHTLYLVPYRGYSGQAGTPSEKAIKADAVQLMAWVGEQHAKVDVLGRSLGTGVAVHVASRPDSPVQRLGLLTPYDSLLAIAKARYPWAPVEWFLRDRFDTCKDAPTVQCPTLVVTAGRDTVVPMVHAERLLPHFTCSVRHVSVPQATHGNIFLAPQAQLALRPFFAARPAPSPELAVTELLARFAAAPCRRAT